MNYIKHLNAIFYKFYGDDRLNYAHLSLYFALFFYWNLHRFPDGFYANRTEIMKLAKIGSRSTSTTCLRKTPLRKPWSECPNSVPVVVQKQDLLVH